MRRYTFIFVSLILSWFHFHAHAGSEANGHESRLIEALDLAKVGKIDQALTSIKQLVTEKPKFRLAQVIYADLLLAQVQPLQAFADSAKISDDFRSQLRAEAYQKYRHAQTHPGDGKIPASVLQISADQAWVIVIDSSASRLYLFRNVHGQPELISDHYITIGKKGFLKTREGDQKTPLGVYFITRRIAPQFLDDFYGTGALSINYPNEWDQRLQRTGYGIWLHGVPSNVYNRFPKASDGCIAMANNDLSSLWGISIGSRTPVVIAPSIDWQPPEKVAAQRHSFAAAVERWRHDWESLDLNRYLWHYSRDFKSEKGEGYGAWRKRKSRVNGSKRYIKVSFDNLNFFSYPSEPNLVVATFDQVYKSDNYSSQSKKRQYWRRENDGQWRIVYEGEAQFQKVHLRGIPFSARS